MPFTKLQHYMAKNPEKNGNRPGAVLRFGLGQKPNPEQPLFAYVFSQQGQLEEKAAVIIEKEEAIAKLGEVSAELLPYHRVFIAPELKPFGPDPENPPTIADLQRFRAYEPVFKWEREAFVAPALPDGLLARWWWRRCRVRGRVQKTIEVDGSPRTFPLCRARVHICEVDYVRLYWPVPDWVYRDLLDIFRRRPGLYELLPEIKVPRWPIPEPDPLPFDRLLPSNAELPRMQALGAPVAGPSLSLAGASFKTSLAQASPRYLGEVLALNPELLRSVLCLYHRFRPYFYRCDELAVIDTDQFGRFDTHIWYNLLDKPDLYFWVEYFIDGAWTTVYHPSLPCHTYWNYECGTEVTINVTHPRVWPLCSPPVTGSVVVVRSIGSGQSVRHIAQALAASAMIQGRTLRQVGLSDFNFTSGDYRSPFGETLALNVYFGSGLQAAGHTHFRWQYRQTHTADLVPVAGTWQTIVPPARPYIAESPRPGGGVKVTTKYFPLNEVAGVYPVPPVAAPLDAGDTFSTWASAFTNGGNLNTVGGPVANGLYEFKLELFSVAGGMATKRTFPAASLPNTFQVPKVGDITDFEDSPAIYLNVAESHFVMKVRIDNQVCTASIKPTQVNGTPAGIECGFVNYINDTDGALLSYEASHPQHFATFGFSVRRGYGVYPPAAQASGMVIGDTSGYGLGADGLYRKTLSVGYLLKADAAGNLTGTCDKAAFAESLAVWATASNGSRRLSEYDRSDLAAFAIAK